MFFFQLLCKIVQRMQSDNFVVISILGPPFPPTNFKVLKIVSNDSLILTWNMPPIDKSGHSNGALVMGYKVSILTTQFF